MDIFRQHFQGKRPHKIHEKNPQQNSPEVLSDKFPSDRRRKKHIDFSNINFLAPPTQNPPILGPQKEVYVPPFLGKDQKKGPT